MRCKGKRALRKAANLEIEISSAFADLWLDAGADFRTDEGAGEYVFASSASRKR
jgi:hypothetical protein